MSEKHGGLRWGRLYLVLPLAALLLWGVDRMHATGARLILAQLGALLIVFGYVEFWRRTRSVAFLHNPFSRGPQPIYRVREVVPPRPKTAVTGTFYSDLFVTTVGVISPSLEPLDAPAGGAEAGERYP